MRVGFFIFLSMVACVGWLYVILVSEAFQIKDIEVRGVRELDPIEVKREAYRLIDSQERGWPWHARHVWFLNAEALRDELTEKLLVDRVTVEKSQGNVLRLMVEERSRRAIVRTAEKSFWIDGHGAMMESLNALEEKDLEARLSNKRASTVNDPPIIHAPSNTVLLMPQGTPDPVIRSWLDIALQVQKQGINYQEIVPSVSTSTSRFALRMSQGYEVWLDTSDTLETQLEAFKAFEKQRPKDVKVQEYVDVRIPSRIYVK